MTPPPASASGILASEVSSKVSPKVSVVCAWFNRAAYLRDTIDSLLAQDYDDFDITIVNDGSPDPQVRAILDSYDDPRLRVIHQQNTGFVGAIRRAISDSRGEYIAMMGAGDVSLPGRLRLQAGALDAGPHYVGMGCSFRSVTIGEDGTELEAEDVVRGARDIDQAYILRHWGSPFTHGEVMYRRSAYEAVGGYRAAFRFSQDMDLWLRMARHGIYTLCPEILYERRSFKADGIQGNLEKSVTQIGFAHLAQECARLYARRGYDYVDVFGAQAGLMYPPDAKMANLHGKVSIKYLQAGLRDEARFFAELSACGVTTRFSLLARILLALSGRPALRPLAQALMRRLPILDKREVLPIPAVRPGKR